MMRIEGANKRFVRKRFVRKRGFNNWRFKKKDLKVKRFVFGKKRKFSLAFINFY